MIRRLLARWATTTHVHAAQRLERRVAELEAEVAVLTVERDKLAAVAARDLQRVKAEAAVHARQQAESEGTHEQRDHESARRYVA